MINRKNTAFLFQPLAASFLAALLFFTIVFAFFRIGYAVDDDISTISILSGYLGGLPLPFPVQSNVLLGLFLSPLYALSSGANWMVWFYIAVNFVSVWGLVYIFASQLPDAKSKSLATLTVLLCDTYFLLNITFTMIAAFATLAGLCLVMTGVQSPLPLRKGLFGPGLVLVLLASLIRFKAMLLMSGLILPMLLFFIHPARLKKQAFAFGLLAILVLGGILFDSSYLQTSPDWAAFQKYNEVRTQLHDTPRKYNVQFDITAQVGWNRTDTKEFFNWFFPDRKTYSLENLQYLVEHIPGAQTSKVKTLSILLSALFSPVPWPYLLAIFSLGPLMLFLGVRKRALYPLITLLLTFSVIGFYLCWTMKFPDRVLLPLLAGVAITGLAILACSRFESDSALLQPRHLPAAQNLYFASLLVISGLAVALVCCQSIETTKINIQKQVAYQQLLVDLQDLGDRGIIARNALIVSPAYAMPLLWANPLTINFPKVQILEMGWLTFSPAYEKALLAFDAQPMPEALYEKKHVYLITPPQYLNGIRDYIYEHKGIHVNAALLYQIAGTEIGLYKLQPSK